MSNQKSESKALTAFKQQRLRAWQPVLTPFPVITSFIGVGIVFIVIGVILLQASNSVYEVEVNYDSSTQVTMEVTKDLQPPVFFYYKLENFYQNQRRYVRSRNDEQLRGQVVNKFSTLNTCAPYTSVNNSKDPEDFYVPCGLIANSMFTDTFIMEASNGDQVEWTKNGIAWESDVKDKFKNPPADSTVGENTKPHQDFEDEDFIVWMRTAGLPTFRKLHRIIQSPVSKGTYTISINNTFEVDSFGGHKSVVLSTASWIGGKNPFLAIGYLVVGSLCILLGLVFLLLYRIKHRPLGDTSLINWDN